MDSSQSNMDKRSFLKLMGGLSLGLLPFVSCYSKTETKEKSTNENTNSSPEASIPVDYNITDKDIQLLTRNDAKFEAHNILFNKRFKSIPKYIAVVYTNLGVKYAIQLAKKEQLPIAIRSGGHSFEGFSTNEGMVINVSNMKKIQWHDDGTVSIEPGIVLRELHDEVYRKGKLISAGTCATVGISGLTLGGGYGLFSRKYGLSCDALLDATIVTADEKVLQAAEHPDLLWALKGAGIGNFGVVTSMTFRTDPLPPKFTKYFFKQQIQSASQFKEILKKWMDVAYKLPPEAFGAFVQNGKTLSMLFTNFGKTDITATVNLFAPKKFTAGNSRNTMDVLPNHYGADGPLFFKNASCGYYNQFEDLEAIAEDIYRKVTQQSGIVFQVNTLGGAIKDKQYEAKSCYPHRQYEYLGELQAYYNKESQGAKIMDAFEEIQQLIHNNGIQYHYNNYPDINFKNWQAAYYGENYAKLQSIKQTFDPDNHFNYAQSITPSS